MTITHLSLETSHPKHVDYLTSFTVMIQNLNRVYCHL